MVTSTFFRLCARAPISLIDLPVPLRRRGRHLDAQLLIEITPRERSWIVRNLVVGAGRDNASAILAGSRPQIDDAVGVPHDLRVMFHHQHGVPQVAQAMQDLDQAGRVSTVQPDGRLVEHVERADQSRAQRGCELNALRLATGQRRSQPVECEVFQSDVVEEAQTVAQSPPATGQRCRLLPATVASSAKKRVASSTVMAETSQMSLPPTFTWRASRRRRRSAAVRAHASTRDSGSETRARAVCISCAPGTRRSRAHPTISRRP